MVVATGEWQCMHHLDPADTAPDPSDECHHRPLRRRPSIVGFLPAGGRRRSVEQPFLSKRHERVT